MGTLELFNSAKAGYNKTKPDKRTDDQFRSLRAAAKNKRAELLRKKTEIANQSETTRKIYRSDIANEKISAMRNEYEESKKTAIDGLKTRLSKLVEARRERVEAYVLEPIPADLMSLLQGYSLRGSRISDTELKMLAEKCGGSYQASQIFSEIANKAGKTALPPFDPDSYLQDLDLAEKRASAILDGIDEPEGSSYVKFAFYGDYDTPPEYAALDDEPAAMTGHNITIMDTLDAAISQAQSKLRESNENLDFEAAGKAARDFNHLSNLKRNNYDLLTTEGERRERARAEAVEMISDAID